MAYSEGSYTATARETATGQQLRESGSYVIVHRMTPGKMWKAVTDTFARSADPAPR